MVVKKKIDRTKKNGFVAKTTVFSFAGVEWEMTDQQKLFCMEYINRKFNASEAALAAGYSQKNAGVSGCALLKIPKIQEFISALQKDIAFCIGVSAIDIAKEYAKVGFSDIRKIFDEDGNLINVKDIPDDPAANIASIEIFEEYQGKGADRQFIGNTKKVKFYDKVNALDKLAKMIGADGVTKVAQTTTTGEDVILLPKKDLHEKK